MRMPRHVRGASIGLAAALTVAGAISATAGTAATTLPTTVLSKAVVPGLDTVTDLGATTGNAKIVVGISLLGLTAAARNAYDTAEFTRGSAEYGHVLTTAEFTQRFSVPAGQASAVRSFATAHGLQLAYTNPDGSYLELNGTPAEIDTTFGVTLEQFKDAEGQVFRATRTGPTVPVGVSAVLGLSDLTNAKLAPITTHPVTAQDTCVGGECTGILTPFDLYDVYDEPSSAKGQGEQVGIFGEGELDTIVKDDAHFQTDQKIRPGQGTIPVRRVLVNDDQTATSGDDEWDLDSAATTGMAPEMDRLTYYFGQDLSDASIAGTYSAWANDPEGPVAGNSSFGGCEILDVLLGGAGVDDALMQQASMEGRTMFASTGDVGGGCGIGPVGVNGVTNGGAPQVEYPSSSDYAVAVGGSTLYTTPVAEDATTTSERFLESAWTNTGGGMSNAEPATAAQKNITLLNVPCAYTTSGGVSTSTSPCRGTPDVEAVSGDVLTNGYTVYTGGADSEGGGTSLSSPLWAGMWARIMSSHPSTCSTTYAETLGFAQPALYAVGDDATADPASFFDIGNVDGTSTPTGNGQYPALPRSALDPQGWDFVSGLGTPDVKGLMKYLDCASYDFQSAGTTYPADVTTGPPTGGCVNGIASDATGDTASAAGVGNVTDHAADLIASTITATSTDLTWKAEVVNLSGSPAGGTESEEFQYVFSYAGGTYDVDASINDPTGGPDTYTFNSYSAGTETALTGTPTGKTDLTANTETIDLPFSVFNAGAKPKANLAPGSAITGLVVNTFGGPGGIVSTDVLSYVTCPFIVRGGSAAAPVPVVTTSSPAPSAPAPSAPTTSAPPVEASPPVQAAAPALASTGLPVGLTAVGLLSLVVAGLVTRKRRQV